MIHVNIGKHTILEKDKNFLESVLPDRHVVKCGSPECDDYLLYVKEYDDSYYVQNLGKARN
jgi:hypothetical protein